MFKLEAQSNVQELTELTGMMEHDEMKQLAGQEIQVCKSQLMKVQGDIREALTPKDEADEHGAIVEIRAGE